MSKNRWSILHEDESLIVINKPADWSSVPDRFDESKKNIYKSLQDYREEIYMVHRLDRDTSGTMVIAKTAAAHKFLNDQFEHRKVGKIYHAFVDGCPIEEHFTIDESIAYSSTRRGEVYISKSGKESSTKFKLIARWKTFSLLECVPLTGRLHQIRIHLKHAGYSLMVDAKYGSRDAFKISEIKNRKKFNIKKDTEERPLISRQTLHAHSLTFVHPESKKKMTFEAEYPKDLRALKNQLNKWNSI